MSPKEKLHRRRIRDTLVRENGWKIDSHVDGSIEFWPGSIRISPAEFERQVREAVASLGYDPTIVDASDSSGGPYVCLHTKETLAQSGRGAHKS